MIEISNLTKSYKNKLALKNINLKINEGKTIAFVGPNGSGKTTLFNIIVGNVRADSGNVEIKKNGYILNTREEKLSAIGFLQDESVLAKNLTGYDHLKFKAKIYNIKEEHFLEVISLFGLEGFIYNKIKNYSLGMKQRLLLALAIIHNPKILILDEPFNGVDYENSNQLKKIFSIFKKRGCTVIFSSHILSDIDRIADNIVFLKVGSVQKEVINNPQENDDNLPLTLTEKHYNELFGEQL